uniref:Uncharacterized protein n=1 Tax=Panagrolaimus davidi TaxID=227884 RepID=A0A914PG19_9BILA
MNSNNISKYFPSDILKWMKINATPLMALKLMQVCKYFQHKKFPYRVIKGISREWDLVDVDEAIEYYTVFEAEESFDINTLDIFDDCSVWITNSVDFYCRINPFSSFLSKIAVCEAKGVDFQYQTLTLEEFKILSSSGTLQWVGCA